MRIVIVLSIMFYGALLHAEEAFLVVPNALESNSGNAALWPFALEQLGINSRRYQQVYEASQFGELGSEGGFIKEIFLRERPTVDRTIANVRIELSTTTRNPETLSATFSDNMGPDVQVVYGAASLRVWTGGTAAPWAVITLSQPFFYNSSNGNLLLDIRTFSGGGRPDDPMPLPQLDAEETAGDSISAVFASDVNANSGFLTTRGLVTGFWVEPIPEPSTWALLGLGLFGMWRFLRRK